MYATRLLSTVTVDSPGPRWRSRLPSALHSQRGRANEFLLSTVTVGGCRPAGAPRYVLSTVTVESKSPLASTRHVLSTATVTEHFLSIEPFMLVRKALFPGEGNS